MRESGSPWLSAWVRRAVFVLVLVPAVCGSLPASAAGPSPPTGLGTNPASPATKVPAPATPSSQGVPAVPGGAPSLPYPATLVDLNSPPCQALSVSPSSAGPNEEIVIVGKNLGPDCKVLFIPPGTTSARNPLEAATQAVDPRHLKAIVPGNLPSGNWLIRVVPKTDVYGLAFRVTPPGAPAGPPPACEITSVSPASAGPNQEVTITGYNLRPECKILFVPVTPGGQANPGFSGTAMEAKIQVVDSTRMKAWVPPSLSPGDWSIRVETVDSWGIAFQATPTKSLCDATSVWPNGAQPNEELSISGHNLGPDCKVIFTDRAGKSAEGRVQAVNASQIKTWVPAALAMGSGRVSVQPRTESGIRPGLPFAIKGPPCEVVSASPPAAEVDDEVVLSGGDYSGNCEIRFVDAAGKDLEAARVAGGDPTVQKTTVPFGLVAGNGYVYGKLRTSPKGGARTPFLIKPSAPIVAKRLDASMLTKGIGSKVSPVSPSKEYTAYSPATPSEPFKCNVSSEVYNNGAVYTYQYHFYTKVRGVDTVVTGSSGYNFPNLSYGLDTGWAGRLQDGSRLQTEVHRKYIRWHTLPAAGNEVTWFVIYLQSMNPPVQGRISLVDIYGQQITADVFVPKE